MKKWRQWWAVHPWKMVPLSGAGLGWAGFTLVELLVGVSVITILFTIGVAKYNEFNRHQILVQAAQELKSNLRLAQNKALAGEKPSEWCAETDQSLEGYQLRFDSDVHYLIEAVCSSGPAEEAKSVNLPANIAGPGGASVLFKVLAQGVEGAGELTLSGSGYGEPQTVTVTAVGEIR